MLTWQHVAMTAIIVPMLVMSWGLLVTERWPWQR